MNGELVLTYLAISISTLLWRLDHIGVSDEHLEKYQKDYLGVAVLIVGIIFFGYTVIGFFVKDESALAFLAISLFLILWGSDHIWVRCKYVGWLASVTGFIFFVYVLIAICGYLIGIALGVLIIILGIIKIILYPLFPGQKKERRRMDEMVNTLILKGNRQG